MATASWTQEWPPQDGESWEDLEYSGCFFCDRPWDHPINPADVSVYLCLDCYEKRYGQGTDGHQHGENLG